MVTPDLYRRVWRHISRFALMLAAALAAPPLLAAAPLKVGFVYVGPIGDAGWTHAHDQGRLALERALPGQVETRYVESVPEGADAERVIRQLAASGHQLIFTTSFGYMEATLKVARQFPKTTFMHATGYKTGANVGTYEAKTYEAAYLLGVLAGASTRSNTLGFVASFPIPEVIRNINAFTLGARSVNPAARTKVIWVNTWYDPGKERQAAEALIAQGADLLCQNTDSPATAQVAQQKGVQACGWDSDMRRFAPDAQYAAGVVDWGPFYIKTAKAVLAGQWQGGQIREGLAEGMVDVISLRPGLPGLDRFTSQRKALAEHQREVFDGPIIDQDGKLRIAKGERPSEAQLLSMDWFVEGVEAPAPH